LQRRRATRKARKVETAAGRADDDSVALTTDDLRAIDGDACRLIVHGAPYPEELERMTGR
jgi:hypothetical protein